MNVQARHNIYLLIVVLCSALLLLTIPLPTEARGDRVGNAFGMNIHLRNRHSDSEWETVMQAAEDAGVEWGREEFSWDVLEPADGEFSYDVYDNVIQSYQDHDIQPLGLLTYSTSWASTNPGSPDYEFYPPDIDAWEDYVNNVASHYKGSVDHWEIWNEPNYSGFWKSDAETYTSYLAVAVDAIKSANPDATVVLGGLSGADADFLDTVYSELNDKSDIDVVAIHPYRVIGDNYNYSPEQTANGLNSLWTDIYNIKAVMNRHGQGNTNIWLTEMGWSTYDEGVSNKQQAQYLMRAYTIALSIPSVRKVFWYALADNSSNESYRESQFGILNHDYAPKVSEDAFRFIKRNLQGAYLKDQTLVRRTIIDNFIHSAGWHFQNTVCTEGKLNDTHKRRMMKVSYRFTADTNCYTPIALDKKLPTGTQMMQFKVKGESDDTLLRVRLVDRTGEVFQYNFGYMPNEWLFYTFNINDYAESWNGDNDGIVDQPATFNSFILDDTDGSYAQGVVYFDELYSSKRGNAYLLRYHKGRKDRYAYWSARKNRTLSVNLTGAGKMRIKRWRNSNKLKKSGQAKYRVRANQSIKFLQTL